jgi:hypothetical protein
MQPYLFSLAVVIYYSGEVRTFCSRIPRLELKLKVELGWGAEFEHEDD